MKIGILAWVMVATVVTACGGGGGGNDGGTSDGGDSGVGSGGSNDNSFVAGPGPQGGSALYSAFRGGKKLVLHQRVGIDVTPANFRDRLANMESVLEGFDGAFMRLPATTASVMKPVTVAASAIAGDLQPLYALKPTRFRYNFAVVEMQRDLDVFDDWTVVLANVGRLARVARDAGLVGIVIDNENPGGLRMGYPADQKYPTKTIDEYRGQTALIGKKIMQAIVTDFPDAAVVVLRGPAGAEPKSPASLVNVEEAETAQLLGSFFAGFVDGKGARSLIVDGGTDYGLRTADQFAASGAWRKTGLPSEATDSLFITSELSLRWATDVNVAFAVRDMDGARGVGLQSIPDIFATTVLAALRNTDTFVWASFDLTDMTKAKATDPWVIAANKAKAAFASPTTVRFTSAMPNTGTGLMAQYFSKIDRGAPQGVTGYELAQTAVDPTIDFNWNGTPTNTILEGQQDNYAVLWTGFIEAPVTGMYTIVTSNDDGMQVSIGDKLVVDSYFDQGPNPDGVPGTPIMLTGGVRYPFKVRYFQGGGGAEAHVWWLTPGATDKVLLPSTSLYPAY